jgi:MazG nucleotide pyrophosphohydrolase domain
MMQPSRDVAQLIEIVEALRRPESGCPWDKEQTFETIVPYTIEEAYEAADAIARGDMAGLKDDLVTSFSRLSFIRGLPRSRRFSISAPWWRQLRKK